MFRDKLSAVKADIESVEKEVEYIEKTAVIKMLEIQTQGVDQHGFRRLAPGGRHRRLRSLRLHRTPTYVPKYKNR
mgnify:CR=1 FL=1